MREKSEIVVALRRPKKETKWLVRIQQGNTHGALDPYVIPHLTADPYPQGNKDTTITQDRSPLEELNCYS